MRPDGETIWVTVTLSIQWDAGGRIQSLIGVIEDIDARKRAELELHTHTARQQLLSKTMDQLLRVDDPRDVMQDIFESLRKSVGLDTFLDYDVMPDNSGIRMATWAGIPDLALEPLMFLQFGQALCGTSAVSRQPVIVDHLQSSTDPKASRMQAVGSTAYACFPLIVGDRLLGTLAFASSTRDSFDSDDLELLEAVSNYVATAKERRRLLHETRQRAEQVAAALEGRVVTNAVNVPAVAADEVGFLGPFLPLARDLGRIASAIVEQAATQIFMANSKARHVDYVAKQVAELDLRMHQIELVESVHAA